MVYQPAFLPTSQLLKESVCCVTEDGYESATGRTMMESLLCELGCFFFHFSIPTWCVVHFCHSTIVCQHVAPSTPSTSIYISCLAVSLLLTTVCVLGQVETCARSCLAEAEWDTQRAPDTVVRVRSLEP